MTGHVLIVVVERQAPSATVGITLQGLRRLKELSRKAKGFLLVVIGKASCGLTPQEGPFASE